MGLLRFEGNWCHLSNASEEINQLVSRYLAKLFLRRLNLIYLYFSNSNSRFLISNHFVKSKMLFRDLEMKLIARRTLSQSFTRFGGYQGNSLHSKGKVTYNAHDVNHGDGVPPSWEQLMGSGNQYFYFHNHVTGWFPAAANTTYEAELGNCQKTVIVFNDFS